MKNQKGFIAIIVYPLVILFTLLVLSVLTYIFIAQPQKVTGKSMAPNFLNGQYVVMEKYNLKPENLHRFDVIVYKSFQSPGTTFIGRIIGLPGETMQIPNGSVYINGKKLEEPFLTPNTFTKAGNFIQEVRVSTIPQDYYAVMGDNRDSRDSRDKGLIYKNDIIGKFWFKYGSTPKSDVATEQTIQPSRIPSPSQDQNQTSDITSEINGFPVYPGADFIKKEVVPPCKEPISGFSTCNVTTYTWTVNESITKVESWYKENGSGWKFSGGAGSLDESGGGVRETYELGQLSYDLDISQPSSQTTVQTTIVLDIPLESPTRN